MTANKVRRRRFRKFLAVSRHGDPLWATLGNTHAEAQERHDRFNPDPTGQGMGAEIVQAEIYLTK